VVRRLRNPGRLEVSRTTFDPFAAVLEFHRKLGVHVEERPGFPDDSVVTLRLSLLREEMAELERAVSERDIVEVADALADLVYVAYGTAISFGIDLRPVFEEVHRSNIAKAGGGIRADGKVLKPADWTPPQIGEILRNTRLGGEESDDSAQGE
jgi:predicted HAD superfamily Cof-like phosphohydrolase